MTKLHFKNINRTVEGVGPSICEIPATVQGTPIQVVFRKYSNGDIIALFPFEPADYEGKFCMSFMHVGQSSGADARHIINTTTPATFDESKALREELSSYPYNFILIEIWRINHETARRVRLNKLSHIAG